MERRSFSFTAAGQSRSCAGFPFKPERMPRHQSRTTTYRGAFVQVNKMLWRAEIAERFSQLDRVHVRRSAHGPLAARPPARVTSIT